ncbi:MAG: DUF4349 domain-containing protein, partial [Leptospiraceae bacterium]|nr:DUF4349 domain-containing protein [Leptospiraceae bacterium]
IIYESELRLEVESIQNSIARTKSLLQEYKGIVEEIETRNSGKEAHLKLRVPVHKFDEALSELEKLGNLLSRSISADDVTDAFTDTKLRLETLKKIRTRLYSLLKLEKKAEEKVKILKEIQRLTTEIELMLTNLEYYKNKSSYSTIQLHLQALAHKTETVYIPSPFSWINNLSPSSISTRYKGFLFDSFKLHKPEDFFDRLSDYKDHKGNYIFTTPGYTSGLRVGYTRNYPKANREFWKQALLLDAKNRYYKVVEETKVSGNYEFISFETSKQEIYSIAFQVREKEIIICEGYFKDKDIYKQYKPSFVSFIEKLEVLR